MKTTQLIPTIIQDDSTKKVLMLGYMNAASLKKTETSGKVWFYSRSRKKLWMKGETSGNTLFVKKIIGDCDDDALLITATPKGPTCHTLTQSCFSSAFAQLYGIISDRKKKLPPSSYTTELFKKGLSSQCEKIYEEAAEVVKAAKKETNQRLTEETVDLLYHLFVVLVQKRVSLETIEAEMRKRME
ncbi:bifunctional phosphoribosyl-AMP cyclohydrolase/phosphoribosyl-ATP diphosphatase HisIE [Candidatus Gracilibacteria bacterium]|nr:bifunctional phosphoribosyl-AMP cyclohydrolase/phosphoribosyl-ATP diphosphatase HisIE [Candidatus Gracilibacteria bacterium]